MFFEAAGQVTLIAETSPVRHLSHRGTRPKELSRAVDTYNQLIPVRRHADMAVKRTLFLRQPGAPLDNNIVERSLKRAILHRKNAYFYRTANGAHVGDLFMSLIHTCELAGVNAFDYLTVLQRHLDVIRETPTAWMPWNYQESVTMLETGAA